jgi:predicted RNA-binding Zn-ribbon protein involved in translation (DUF1610 family)
MDQVSYFRSHPPRCIAGFTSRPVTLPGVNFDGHGSLISSVFALACFCVSGQHFIHGFSWINPDNFDNTPVFLSPMSLECTTCGKRTDLIDTDAHGYDAKLGHILATARGRGDPSVYECPECGRQPLDAFARFEYPYELFEKTSRSLPGASRTCSVGSACWENAAGALSCWRWQTLSAPSRPHGGLIAPVRGRDRRPGLRAIALQQYSAAWRQQR